jgi:hypothetical protein
MAEFLFITVHDFYNVFTTTSKQYLLVAFCIPGIGLCIVLDMSIVAMDELLQL